MPNWINEAFESYISKLKHEFMPQLIEIKPEKKFNSIEQKKLSEAEKILAHPTQNKQPRTPTKIREKNRIE